MCIACQSCQKAHLTCDDARPCARCIKRGLQDSCQDGIRKKAKYLQDAIEGISTPIETVQPTTLEGLKLMFPVATDHKPNDQQQQQISPTMPPPMTANTINPSFVQNTSNAQMKQYEPQSYFKDLSSDPNLFSFNLSSYNFGSETANLEYSILSNMLNTSGLTPTSDAKSDPHSHPTPPQRLTTPTMQIRNTFPDLAMQADVHGWPDHPTLGSFPYTTMAGPTTSASLTSPSPPAPSPSNPPPTPIQATITPLGTGPPGPGTTEGQTQVKRGPGRPKGRKDTNPRHLHHKHDHGEGDVYSRVTKPFSYVEGFHEFARYLKRRFKREELVRISGAMAKYRPSFIALTKTLKEEDLVFMEKCFQRTLMEYEKFISYSGTPTVVWRRTGQIALVGKEFCLLTKWTRDQLLDKRTFIAEVYNLLSSCWCI